MLLRCPHRWSDPRGSSHLDDQTGTSSLPESPHSSEREAEVLRQLRHLEDENTALRAELARGSTAVQKILDSLPVGIAYVDANECYRLVNGAYARWFGLKDADFVGRSVAEADGPSRYARLAATIQGALNGIPQTFDLHIDAPNGRAFDFSVQYLPDIVEGKTVGYFVLAEDLTERREGARRVEWSETLLREALSSASMMAWECDVPNRRTSRTSNAELVLGFVPESSEMEIGERIHPDDLALTRDVLTDSIRLMTPYTVRFGFQRPDDGDWRWLETRATPSRTDDGGFFVRGLIADVTDRQQLEAN